MSEVDLTKYRRHVEHLDLSDREKTELLAALWRIMESFVDRAFGDDPVQLAQQQIVQRSVSAAKLHGAERPAVKRARDAGPVLDSDTTASPRKAQAVAAVFKRSSRGKKEGDS
ncbi:MAG: hypothetical protein BGO82_10685 [Devosia sp. 67-54]|uniref:hypothetical protein n=1 Tax=unclassified Devosia TaxID=196773 RepID=UPI00096392C8|nr:MULTISPECIES: hypothetical protein [unclassified Devosia]MBN9304899.1 hypothetical protein [Devosia sp.]OJX15149.1 MAG: hypothetical protein BGO82_10685 [Devosia sp. 67-54]